MCWFQNPAWMITLKFSNSFGQNPPNQTKPWVTLHCRCLKLAWNVRCIFNNSSSSVGSVNNILFWYLELGSVHNRSRSSFLVYDPIYFSRVALFSQFITLRCLSLSSFCVFVCLFFYGCVLLTYPLVSSIGSSVQLTLQIHVLLLSWISGFNSWLNLVLKKVTLDASDSPKPIPCSCLFFHYLPLTSSNGINLSLNANLTGKWQLQSYFTCLTWAI